MTVDIAGAHGITPAQVALAWALQHGVSFTPWSTRPAHQRSNLAAVGVLLTGEEVARIDPLDRGERIVDPAGLAPDWDR